MKRTKRNANGCKINESCEQRMRGEEYEAHVDTNNRKNNTFKIGLINCGRFLVARGCGNVACHEFPCDIIRKTEEGRM